MSSKITPVPPLPKEILNAVNNENLAVFIGAGVSRLVGCLAWTELAKNLVNRCFTEKRSDGSSLINYKEKDTLIQNLDNKKTITICHYILKEAGLEAAFFDEMKKALKEGEKLISPNIYDELYKLRGLFITTNADTHFDRLFNPTNVLYKETDFVPNRIDREYLYHVHGSIQDQGSIVFTVHQYLKRYNNPQFRDFLKRILDKYVVLFIGYGLSEFELLDFLFEKFDSRKKKELKHFILLPFYRGEENILNFEQAYYNTLGITVLPYEKDEKGYYQLYEVIKSSSGHWEQRGFFLQKSFPVFTIKA